MSNTISDVLTRISSIQQQLQQLQSGSLLDSKLGVSGGAAGAPTSAAGASASSFANQLAAAQATTGSGTASGGLTSGGLTSGGLTSAALASSGSTGGVGAAYGALSQTALGNAVSGSALLTGGAGLTGTGLTGTALGAGVSALPASAASMLTSGQQQFAATLASETGLNPGVVTSWLLAEESGGAAQSRQAAGNNDWLNVGYTDSATYGAGDSVWSDPVSAATATAQWLKGQDSIPGYGTASAGVQAILATVGQAPEQQIQAIQGSGWASGGYPSLDSLYAQVTQ